MTPVKSSVMREERAMAANGGNERRWSGAPGDSSLLPMLISGLVLIVIGMIAVAVFA